MTPVQRDVGQLPQEESPSDGSPSREPAEAASDGVSESFERADPLWSWKSRFAWTLTLSVLAFGSTFVSGPGLMLMLPLLLGVMAAGVAIAPSPSGKSRVGLVASFPAGALVLFALLIIVAQVEIPRENQGHETH